MLTLPGLPEETVERPCSAYTVVGLRDLLKAKGAPSVGPKAELSRRLAEFQDGPDLDLVDPWRDPMFLELMDSNSRQELMARCANEGLAVMGAKDELAMRLVESMFGGEVMFRRRGSKSEFYSGAWNRYVTRDDWSTGDAGESHVVEQFS